MGLCKLIDVPVTVQAAAYATGELVGGASGALVIAVPGVKYTGRIRSLVLTDASNQKSALEVHFFNTSLSSTTFTENGAFDIADGDAESCIGYVALASASYISYADNAVIAVGGLDFPYTAATSGNIYAVIVCRGSPTYVAVTDLNMKVGVEYDV